MDNQRGVYEPVLEAFGCTDLPGHANEAANSSGGGLYTDADSLLSINDTMSKIMKKLVFLVCLLGAGASAPISASASTVSLIDNSFTSVTYEGFANGTFGPIIGFTETSDGVSFSFSRISGQFRKIGTWGNGLFSAPPFAAEIGGGGGSVTGFLLTTSQDVQFNSFSGLAANGNINPVFSVIGGSVSSIGNTFSASGFVGNPPTSNAFVGGPLALSAGVSYVFDVTNSGVNTRGHFTSFNFSKVTNSTAVPLPAALPLLAGGLGLIGVMGWRRKRSAT